ncbi:MAG: hypothetical protein IPL46_00020 [Saprospiraceae bacterium]|nr:hypothetical protein [Saprospiraceae bacterium]
MNTYPILFYRVVMFLRRDRKTCLICLLCALFVANGYSQSEFSHQIIPIDKSRFTKNLPEDLIATRWQRLMNLTCSEVLNVWRHSDEGGEISGEYLDFGYLENNSKTGEFGPETKEVFARPPSQLTRFRLRYLPKLMNLV